MNGYFKRDSNIELYRIIVMLFLVLHHYVLHSGLLDLALQNPTESKSLFYFVACMWGKIGINCFVLITGYYMCTSNISLRKWAKLLLEVWFYNIVINAIFILTGYLPLSMDVMLKMLIPIGKVGENFASSYLVFYLFIPFLNVLIKNITQKQHVYLVGLIALFFVIAPYLPVYTVRVNAVMWFICIYIIAAYLRLYFIPQNFIHNKSLYTITIISTIMAIVSVIIGAYTGLYKAYLFVFDYNALLALILSILFFICAIQTKLPYSKLINTVAASTFGVLLIHDNSPHMQKWLWKDFLHVTDVLCSPWYNQVGYMIACVCTIFIICTIIDWMRQYLVESYVFRQLDVLFNTKDYWTLI